MSTRITLIGNVNIDLIMGAVAPWPRPGTEVIVPQSDWRVGGSAGNSALALQALGHDFRLISNRGNDAFGQWLAKPFADKADAWAVSDAATGLSVGLTHPDGERTFISALGHLLHFSLEDVLKQLPHRAFDREIALLSGAFVTPALRARYGDLMGELKVRGYRIALDPGWPAQGWDGDTQVTVMAWCRDSDIVLVNEIEAIGLSGLETGDIGVAGAALHSKLSSQTQLVIKRGALGAKAWTGQEVFACQASRTAVQDTIGAGDVFNAAYLATLSNGGGCSSALAFAVKTASLAISTNPRRYTP
jgi:sugar/nucleoside kinase (ribokinase family)